MPGEHRMRVSKDELGEPSRELARFDLHVHTELSPDSVIRLGEIAPVVKSRGLSGLAITDHNRVWTGSLPGRDELIVIPGVEVRTESYEIIGLFVAELPRSSDPMEVIDEIHAQSGIAVLPHPYAFPRKAFSKLSGLEEVAARVDAVEVLNARNLMPSQNLRARALAEALGKAEVAGSDAHTPGELGAAYTIVRGARTPQEVYEGIRRRETCVQGSLSPPSVHLASFAASMMKRLRWRSKGQRG